MSDGVVYVLGAGFTRALVPQAPLLVDDHGILQLKSNFDAFPHAKTILDDTLAEFSDNRVDLERLMTRLSGMPYDTVDARREFALVESALRKTLVKRLTEAAMNKDVEKVKLNKFARMVREQKASIVTFNYDDVLDRALYLDAQYGIQPPAQHAWHPDGGYGFYCRPSTVCVTDAPTQMDDTNSLVLKLHGSINWRSRLGEGASLGPAAILHHEDWTVKKIQFHQPDYNRIESHLEPDPFIVPPVLVKAELATHPVLSVVWALAFERLKAAKTVVFIGYSLPETDLAARTLFRESLQRRQGLNVQIVNYAQCDKDKEKIRRTYLNLFRHLTDANFYFGGATAWIDCQPVDEPTASSETKGSA